MLVCDAFSYELSVCGGFLYRLWVCDGFSYGLLVCGGFLCILLVCDGFSFELFLLKLFLVWKGDMCMLGDLYASLLQELLAIDVFLQIVSMRWFFYTNY